MSGGVYGGDEVGAIVFDAGSHTFRVGYAGEEYPKMDIPSVVAIQECVDEEMSEGGEQIGKKRKTYLGSTKITVPRANTEIKPIMKDGMIEDWENFENMLNHIYDNALCAGSQYHPALFTESAWNERSKREKLCELMFEKYQVPAFHLVKNAVLTAFANGRTGGLVVDSGATHTSAVPVYEGYCITHAVVRSPIGGDLIADQLRMLLEEQNIDIVPTYRVASKEEVSENESPRWTERKIPPVTDSYDQYMKKAVLEDLAASVLQCCDTPLDMEFAEKLPSTPYAFPNGYIKDFLSDRVRVPEGLFDLNTLRPFPGKETLMNVSQIAATSCGMCDIDIRSALYSGLMVTGGNSLTLGFTERLNHDLAHKCPPTIKLRVSAAPTPMERRFGAWIGGSIVASLGSFQQMWVSKAEFDESGGGIVEKKCP